MVWSGHGKCVITRPNNKSTAFWISLRSRSDSWLVAIVILPRSARHKCSNDRTAKLRVCTEAVTISESHDQLEVACTDNYQVGSSVPCNHHRTNIRTSRPKDGAAAWLHPNRIGTQ